MAAEDELIQRLADQLGISGAAAQDLAKSLKDATSASSRMANASSAETAARTASTDSYKKVTSGMKAWTAQAGSATTGLVTLAGSVSGSTAAFTSLIPILNSMQSVLQLSVEALSGGFKAIVGGAASVLGRRFGGNIAGVLKNVTDPVIKAGILKTLELVFTGARLLLSETQKLANSYATLAQSGMIFGGSLENAKAAAEESGVSLQTFSTFASKSAEALALIGGNSETSAKRIMKMATSMDDAMIGMYGGFDNMAASLADYVVMQTKYGYDAVKNQGQLEAGAKSYLLAQKELQILTGKSADSIKQEQQLRLQSAAFQMKLNQLNDPAKAQRVQNLATQINQKYGARALSTFMEKFTNEGAAVMNPENLKFLTMLPGMGDALDQFVDTVDLGDKESSAAQAQLFELNKPMIEGFAAQYQQLMQIQASFVGMNSVLDMLNTALSPMVASLSQQGNAIQAQLDASKSVGEALKRTDSIIGAAIRSLEGMSVAVEKVVIENFDKLPTIIKLTNEAFTAMLAGIRILTTDMKSLEDVLARIVKLAGGGNITPTTSDQREEFRKDQTQRMTPPKGPDGKPDYDAKVTPEEERRANVPYTGDPTRRIPRAIRERQREQLEAERLKKEGTAVPVTPAPAAATNLTAHQQKLLEIYQSAGEWGMLGSYLNDLVTKTRKERIEEARMPQKADGGIVNSPSIAGEAGPEAVIPLKNGGIPLDINFSEMLAELRDQTLFARELLDQMRDSKDIQQQILYATA